MYVPSHFEVKEREDLFAFLGRHSFATLFSLVDGEPFASHVPLLLDPGLGPNGTLTGHVARANPQWRAFDGEKRALAVFHGPHAYVSPAWYRTTPAVPTWNYAAVHVYGRPRAFDEPAKLERLVDRMVTAYESGRERPWPGELPAAFKSGLLRGIVGFSLEVERMEGKFKLGQNRPQADQEGVVRALEASSDPGDGALAAFTRARWTRPESR